MSYEIVWTDKAIDRLRNIAFYLSDVANDSHSGLAFSEKIQTVIHRLQEFPYSGTITQHSILKRLGLRVLVLERYLVFYKVDESLKQVILQAIVDDKSDYARFL